MGTERGEIDGVKLVKTWGSGCEEGKSKGGGLSDKADGEAVWQFIARRLSWLERATSQPTT